MAQCQWPEAEREGRCIDLYYHRTKHFDIQRYIQNESAREGVSLTWEKVIDKAKCQEYVGKEYARYRKEKGAGSTPSYGDPSLAADAISRGFKKPQPRPQRQSGGSGRENYSQQCNRCGKSNGYNGKKGTCPAWGKECSLCNRPNYFKAACRSGVKKVGGGGPQQKQGTTKKSPGKFKAKAKYKADNAEWKTVPSAKSVLSNMDEAVENSVTSEESRCLSKPATWGNLVLKGNRQSSTFLSKTHSVFSCDAIHNTGHSTLDQCHTDTDPSGQLCIMTDILVKATATFWTHNIRVKVDPGAEANLMPVHHFRRIFPYMRDSNGQPKEGVLEKAESSFESYSRDNVLVIGQTLIWVTRKFIEGVQGQWVTLVKWVTQHLCDL